MARTQNTITGRMSGSIGGIRFSTWKGINVAASKPEKVSNPKTLKQMTQRIKMAGVVSLYRAAPDLFSLGFVQYAVKKSGFNAFVSENIKTDLITEENGGAITDYTKLIASRGTLSPTALSPIVRNDGQDKVIIAYPTAATGDQLPTDLVCALVLTDKGNYGVSLWSGKTRTDGTVTVTMARAMAGDENLNVYVFFYQEGSRKVSDNAYKLVQAI